MWPDKIKEEYKQIIPCRRFGEPADVAAPSVFDLPRGPVRYGPGALGGRREEHVSRLCGRGPNPPSPRVCEPAKTKRSRTQGTRKGRQGPGTGFPGRFCGDEHGQLKTRSLPLSASRWAINKAEITRETSVRERPQRRFAGHRRTLVMEFEDNFERSIPDEEAERSRPSGRPSTTSWPTTGTTAKSPEPPSGSPDRPDRPAGTRARSHPALNAKGDARRPGGKHRR